MSYGKNSLVSVVVAVHNVEKYLPRCIESILRQSHKELDVILIDDGSSDKSGRICDKYAKKDDRIRVIHQENGGVSKARNVGLENMRGKFVSFVDSDDWVDCRMIERLFSAMAKCKADIVECGFREIHDDYMLVDYPCTGEVEEFSRVEAISECIQWKKIKSVPWNKLYTREVLEGIRYPVGRLHEDEFVTHRILYNAKRIVLLDLALYNYNCTNGDSITAQFKEQNLDACEATRQKIQFMLEHDDTRPLVDIACNVYCFTLFDNLTRSLDAGKAGSSGVEETVKKAIDERDELFKHKIEPLYKECLNDLVYGGLEKSVDRWKRRKGTGL